MPVADTDLLFALNPKDKKHKKALKLISNLRGIKVPDTALFEFVVVLKARGRKAEEIKEAVLALKDIFDRNLIREVKTIDADLITKQAEIEENYGLTFFDSLIAASALKLDKTVISDDKAFDKVPELKRIPISEV
ncbi:PIN domain-containing protein [Ferroglobus sp.]|uniref:type II toxin-antitoxin system VapC family toxin n=1 Tax=Ferroglobus sp. TaxID=2614230 RepID=UPI0025C0A592|nr:PIN domain-containing protein [Ferroglobus sp.]